MSKQTKRDQANLTEQVSEDGLFVTTSEVAKALRYTPKAIREMIERGDLPGRKFGGEWRMHRADFEKLTAPQLAESAA